MNSTLKMAFVAAAVVVAGSACSPVAVAPPSAAVVSPEPKASPSHQAATAAPTPTPNLLDTSTWTTYVSKRYGFSIAHPADWTEDPSDHDWTMAKDAANPLNRGPEHFGNEGVGVSVWSVAVDPGTSVDSWLQGFCQKNNVDCTGILDRAVASTMDGRAGSLVVFDGVDGVPLALFLVDGRIYAIACWRSDDDPTVLKYSGSIRLVEAYLSTMHLTHGGPAPSGRTASPS